MSLEAGLDAISYSRDISMEKSVFSFRFSAKSERKMLKAILLGQLHQLLSGLFRNKIQFDQNNSSMECYAMDSKIIQLLIQSIVETGEYSLEGIALYTQIPLDVIYDAACGVNNQLSITPWARVVDLFMQVKPDVTQILIDKLLEIKDKCRAAFSSLLNEK